MIKREFYLGREKMLSYLAEIAEKQISEEMTSIYLPPGLKDHEISRTLDTVNQDINRKELVKIIGNSNEGACVFSGIATVLVIPPFAIKEKVILQGYEMKGLVDILNSNLMIGIVLVRLGSFALGVCQGEKILTSKVGTGLVHGRQRQGGSSSHRFEHRRDKQIETFLTRMCNHFNEHISPYIDSLDYAVYGGARTTVELFKKRCRFAERLEGKLLPPLFDMPDPRQYVLEAAIKRIWSSRIIEWTAEV
jgi:hypothetical protein